MGRFAETYLNDEDQAAVIQSKKTQPVKAEPVKAKPKAQPKKVPSEKSPTQAKSFKMSQKSYDQLFAIKEQYGTPIAKSFEKAVNDYYERLMG